MFTLILDPDIKPTKVADDVFVLGGSALEQAASAALRIRAFVELLELHWGGDLGVPAWLVSGTAARANDLYRLKLGETSADELRSNRRAEVREHPTRSLGDLEDATRHRSVGQVADALSALAVEWLERHAALIAGRPPSIAEPAFVEFYRLLAASGDWQQSFVEAFGLSADDFYVAFAAERGTPAGHPAHEFDARHAPLLVLLGDVPTDVEVAVRADMRAAQTFFAEHFGAEPADYTVYVAADWASVEDAYRVFFERGPIPGRRCLDDHYRGAVFMIQPCSEPLSSLLGWFHFRNVQERIAPRANPFYPGTDGVHPQGADWLHRGTEFYARYAHLAFLDPSAAARMRDQQTLVASWASESLREIESFARHHTFSSEIAAWRARGFFAAEWLAHQVGAPALLNYYRIVPNAANWRDAFEETFGLTVDAFYEVVEPHIHGIAQPIPHLADDRHEPLLVLLGDISPEEEAEVREDFQIAQTFFRERLGAPDADYTVYVAADDESAWEPFRKAFGRDPDPGFCYTASQGSALVMTLDCGKPLAEHLGRYHFINVTGIVQREAGSAHPGPLWLEDAIEGYARHSYFMVAVPGSASWLRPHLISRAQETELPLSALETYDATTTPGPWITWSLGYFAAELLVERQGERALLDYFRQSSGSVPWQDTFEAVFGIAVEDFYEEFEAYRVHFGHPQE